MGTLRRSGKWMVIWDDRILELLYMNGPQAPSSIAAEDGIPVGAANISYRMGKLSEHGFVEEQDNGVYAITHRGRLYLFGGYNAETGTRLLEEADEGLYGYEFLWLKFREYLDAVRR